MRLYVLMDVELGIWSNVLLVYVFQVFRQRTSVETIDFVGHLLEYTPSLRYTPIEACAHVYFDELRDPTTRFPTGRELPPLFNFTPAG